jgi:hypothetical protein
MTFMAFDVFHMDGWTVRRLPCACRRELLRKLQLDGPAWRTPRRLVRNADRVVAAAGRGRELGLDAHRRAMLLDVLAKHELPRRAAPRVSGARSAAPVVQVLVDAHGSPAVPVRDAIMRQIPFVP